MALRRAGVDVLRKAAAASQTLQSLGLPAAVASQPSVRSLPLCLPDASRPPLSDTRGAGPQEQKGKRQKACLPPRPPQMLSELASVSSLPASPSYLCREALASFSSILPVGGSRFREKELICS
jgi:hypothetical protein